MHPQITYIFDLLNSFLIIVVAIDTFGFNWLGSALRVRGLRPDDKPLSTPFL